MTTAEVIVVVLGLVAGWSIISLVFGRASLRKLRALGLREYSDEDLSNSWPELLQVRRAAAAEDIRAALRKRQEDLRGSFPAVMTDVETGQYERAVAVLGRAAALATSGSRRTSSP